MGEVTIDSAIPDSHPQKAAIEGAIRALLDRMAGSWGVSIDTLSVHIEDDVWWAIAVFNAWGFSWRLYVDSPEKQTAEFIAKQLQAALNSQGAGQQPH